MANENVFIMHDVKQALVSVQELESECTNCRMFCLRRAGQRAASDPQRTTSFRHIPAGSRADAEKRESRREVLGCHRMNSGEVRGQTQPHCTL